MNDAPVLGAARVGPGDLDPAGFAALRTGAIVAREDAAVVALSGAGAVACMQGLLTNDVEKPGDGAFVYGAMLTAKGMIVVDGWAARHNPTVTFTMPADVRSRALAIFTRSVPPRLARVEDRSSDGAVLRLAGPAALERCSTLAEFLPLPPPGRAALHPDGWEIARPPDGAPFVLQLMGPRAAVAVLEDRLGRAGIHIADRPILEAARVLAGWGRIGAEIDEKTIPQEVRFDELGGVSYTKGCYTGQETVSRLHFRGHVNRYLRGLRFDDAPGDATTVEQQDREVGRVTSLVWLPEGASRGQWIGLALLRRDVLPGTMARAGNSDVRVVDLPFTL